MPAKVRVTIVDDEKGDVLEQLTVESDVEDDTPNELATAIRDDIENIYETVE